MKVLKAEDFKRLPRMKAVEIPELGGVVYIKAFSFSDWRYFQKNPEVNYFKYAIVDELGNPIFNDETVAYFEANEVSLVKTLVEAITEFNDLKSEDAKKN